MHVRTPSAVAPATTRTRPFTWPTTVSKTFARSPSFMRATSLVTPSAVSPFTPAPTNRSTTRFRLSRSTSPPAVKGVGTTEYTPSNLKPFPPECFGITLLLYPKPCLPTPSSAARSRLPMTTSPPRSAPPEPCGTNSSPPSTCPSTSGIPTRSRPAGRSKLKHGKRTILYLAPCHGSFRALFILGPKAVAAAPAAKLSKSLLKLIDEAPRYPEGTGVRLEVKSRKYLPAIRKLAALKLAH